MPDHKTLIDEIFAQWYAVRKALIREISVIPPARFSFRATLETRSIMELAQHILEVAIMTTEELLRDDTDFHRGTLPQLANIYAPNISRADTQEKIVNLLVEQYTDADARLRERGELWMLQLVTLKDGSTGTRLIALHDAIAHESYHTGQLTVFTRLLGLEPAVTRESPRPPLPSITDRV
jgi:uncharacterized damage-inducible protein DinB